MLDSIGFSHCGNLWWKADKVLKMSQERTFPEKKLFNPLRREKDTVKCCHHVMYSGNLFVRPVCLALFVRPVFAIPGKKDTWEFQILIAIGLIYPKY